MSIEIGIMTAVISCGIGLATFVIGRMTAAKNEGETFGAFSAEMKVSIASIQRDIERTQKDIELIRTSYIHDLQELKQHISKETEDLRASIRRCHERIDHIEIK